MKIGIFSDTHLGFDEKGQRCEDSFLALNQAIELCTSKNVDFMLLPGDVFDTTVPSHTVLFKSVNSFSKAKNSASQVKLKVEKNNEVRDIIFSGIPILAIHGNHEYLGKEKRTALDVLNASNLLIYFHAAKITAQKGDEKVCIFGLGAVPEKMAFEVLKEWNPIPEKNCTNLLLTHQGYKDFMALDDEMIASICLEDLPKGFDLIVNGHLHWSNLHKGPGINFLLAGSTIPTSIKKLESEKPKGVYIYDTASKSLNFEPFALQRKMFYHKIIFSEADSQKVFAECKKLLDLDLSDSYEMKPLIRLNLKGTIKKGFSNSDIDISQIENTYSQKALLSISKDFSSATFKAKISELRDMQKSKLSVVSLGFAILEKNLKETEFGSNIDAKKLFELLSKNEIDEAQKVILAK